MGDREQLVHATGVCLGRATALIRGEPGAGKSDLALRCIALSPCDLLDTPLRLLADDYVLLTRQGARLLARTPATIAGKLEVRGLGVVALPHTPEGDVRLIVELCEAGRIERLPDPAATASLLGVEVPVRRLAPFEASAPLKLALALAGATIA